MARWEWISDNRKSQKRVFAVEKSMKLLGYQKLVMFISGLGFGVPLPLGPEVREEDRPVCRRHGRSLVPKHFQMFHLLGLN